MNRVWDYIGFAVWFAGLGYIVHVAAAGPARPSDAAAGVLHALGVASAHVRSRCAWSAAPSAGGAPRPRAAARGAARARPAVRCCVRRGASRRYPLRTVKPRSHFGLRGTPQ